jgi:hypothetical protein
MLEPRARQWSLSATPGAEARGVRASARKGGRHPGAQLDARRADDPLNSPGTIEVHATLEQCAGIADIAWITDPLEQ